MEEDEAQDLRSAILSAAEEYEADIYLYSGSIDHGGFSKVIDAYSSSGRPNVIVILTTLGGIANSAYKISRFFQCQYERFIIFIPSVCKSAGTLLCLGADQILMTTFSELGPLDVQLYERDEIGARKSGLLTHSAFEALKIETFDLYEHFLLSIKQRSGDNISFPIASEVAGDMASRVMSPIFEQISPFTLGSDYRDLQVAMQYGIRLASHSENTKPNAVSFLTEQYPSHDFIIDKQEAELLFENVAGPSASLWALLKQLGPAAFSPADSTIVNNLTARLENEDADESVEETRRESNMADREKTDRHGPKRSRGKRTKSAAHNDQAEN